ncbi:MAG: FAD-binding protein [Calditrichaeota bacterium]|nr:FAD-binding protein [Calditrichota bacterium]
MTTEASFTSSAWPDPGGTLQPRERSQVGELIVQARSRQVTIGSPQATYRWDLSRLDRVVSFHAPDMILTVETGLTLNAVKDIVEAEKLWLPLDMPGGGDRSLAEYLAGDDSLSWLSHRYGTVRDWIMGLTALDDQGREVTSGARVVRNVSGYQLAPLYIGAGDTLGPIVEVSFRLQPLPVPATVVSWQADNPDPLVAIWQQSRRISHPSGRGEPWEAFRLEHLDGQWRLDGMTRFPPEDVAAWEGPSSGLRLARWATPRGAGSAGIVSKEAIIETRVPPREGRRNALQSNIRIQVFATQVPELLASLHSLGVELTCYPAAGVIRVGRLDGIRERSALESLLAAVVDKGGRVQPMTADVPVKIPAPTSLSADRVLMTRVKRVLDPDGVFGPLPVEQW